MRHPPRVPRESALDALDLERVASAHRYHSTNGPLLRLAIAGGSIAALLSISCAVAGFDGSGVSVWIRPTAVARRAFNAPAPDAFRGRLDLVELGDWISRVRDLLRDDTLPH